MNNPLIQKAKQTPQQIAQKVAQVAKTEIMEASKTATAQVTGQEKSQSGSPVVEAMQQGSASVTQEAHDGIHTNETRQLRYLQDELDKLKRLRELVKQQEAHEQLQEDSGVQSAQESRQLVVPPSPPKKGMVGVRRKQQKMEIGKTGTG